jgi:hypothetical protein
MSDPINPNHYKSHPSGIECIQITEHLNFCRGNAIKYLWRAGEKGDVIEDLRKAKWYVEREIARLEFIEKDKFRSEEILVGEGLEGETSMNQRKTVAGKSFASCPKCKAIISYNRAKDAEIEQARDAEKAFQVATAAMLEASRKEKIRRDHVEIYLKDKIHQLETEIKEMQENRRTT